MAANFWDSTHNRRWLFSKEQLEETRQQTAQNEQALTQMYPLPEWRHINIYFNQQLNRLAKRLQIRQQAIATAQVYMKRCYLKVEIRRTNPYLMIATALYLACKTEECPHHIRMICQETRSLWPDMLTVDVPRLGEFEFFIISEMSSQLVVHQPYWTLTKLQADFSLASDERNLAWSFINDHYMTDLPLLYPPHLIALTAILFSLIFRPGPMPGAPPTPAISMTSASAALAQAAANWGMQPSGPGSSSGQISSSNTDGSKSTEGRMGKVQKYASFLAESEVNIEAMIDISQEVISFYECHETYNDKTTRDQINRFVKARGLDKS